MRRHGIVLLLLLAPDAFGGEVITGTATFRERIAVPPAAVFEASLEDVSRADAPADVIGQVRVDSPGNPPIRFEIAYEATRIEPSHTYSVRARIIVDGQLMFVTDRIYLVLTRGAGSTVEILLKRTSGPVPRSSGEGGVRATPETTLAARGLRVPATFRGDLPCADCEAMRHHLDLWPDQVFHLHREWVGRNLVRDEVGRWRVDPSRQALILYGGSDMPLQFEIQRPDRIRLLDQAGKPIVSILPYELVSDGTFTPMDLNLPLAGEMISMANAASSLTNTYWRIVKLGEEPIQAVEGRREPHLVLRKGEGRPTAVATVGCNHMTASYTLGGESLIFTEPASTKMACPPPLDELEEHLRDMLAKARRWRMQGPMLELSDESGTTVGLLEAVSF